MKRNIFTRITEKYTFGAIALREEIKRQKIQKEEQGNIFKALGLRVLYVYSFIVAIVLIGIGLVWQGIGSIIVIFRRKKDNE